MNQYPQFQGPPGHMPGGFPGGVPPRMQQGVPGMPMMDPHLAMLQQQGYIQQQQQLAAAAAAAAGMPGGIPPPMLPPGAMMRQQQGPAHPTPPPKKKKRQQQAQVLPRHIQAVPAAPGSEQYVKNAMAPPGMQQPIAPPTMPAGIQAAGADVIEPWADVLDELDPREIAMNRFRVRQEIMLEIFGPERAQDITVDEQDPWEGLGLKDETLTAKVTALETYNAELEAKFDAELEAFRKRLEQPAETGHAS